MRFRCNCWATQVSCDANAKVERHVCYSSILLISVSSFGLKYVAVIRSALPWQYSIYSRMQWHFVVWFGLNTLTQFTKLDLMPWLIDYAVDNNNNCSHNKMIYVFEVCQCFEPINIGTWYQYHCRINNKISPALLFVQWKCVRLFGMRKLFVGWKLNYE